MAEDRLLWLSFPRIHFNVYFLWSAGISALLLVCVLCLVGFVFSSLTVAMLFSVLSGLFLVHFMGPSVSKGGDFGVCELAAELYYVETLLRVLVWCVSDGGLFVAS